MAWLDLAAELSGEQSRQIEVAMQIAVAHSAAVKDEAVIEQRAIALLGGLQLLQEVAQQRGVINVDLRLLGDQIRIVSMMRDGVVLIRHSDMGESPRTELAGKDHREDPRDVGLVRERYQVQHHFRVLVE